MEDVEAKKALKYAFGYQMALLYSVVITGMVLTGYGASIYAELSKTNLQVFGARYLFSTLVFGSGLLMIYGGLVAIIFKLLRDSKTELEE